MIVEKDGNSGYMIKKVFLINTSHVDITWWNSPEKCVERIVETIDEAIRLADSDPDFRFSIESVLSVYLFLKAKPGRRGDLVRIVNEGRMDIGGLYVAPVSDYSFDEALFRNLSYGKQWLFENLGIDTPLAREEDSPGHTLQFPQLCRGFGMKFLRFSRGPTGVFRWKSPDGSEVLTFTASYSWGYWPRLGISFDDKVSSGIPLRLRQAEALKYPLEAMMLPDGDDNALPNPDLPRLASAWNALNGSPHLQTATMLDFFREIEDDSIPIFSGDIPNQWTQIAVFQPDCFEIIKDLRQILPMAEMCLAASDTESNGCPERPDAILEPVWRALLEGLDHNWGGRLQGDYGLVCDLRKLDELHDARESLFKITAQASSALASRVPRMEDSIPLVVFNTLSCTRTSPAVFSVDSNIEISGITDALGTPCPFQMVHGENGTRRFIFLASDVPSAGYKTFHIHKGACRTSLCISDDQLHENVIANRFYRVTGHNNGAGIMSIYDREIGVEILPDVTGGFLNLFGIRMRFNEPWALGFRFDPAPDGFYDNPLNEGKVGESIVITGDITTVGECAGNVGRAGFIRTDGPVFSSLKSTMPFIGESTVEQEVMLYHGVKRIDLRTTINWSGAENYLVCLSLPFGPAGGIMTMDVPYGSHVIGNEVPGFWGKTGDVPSTIRTIDRILPERTKMWLRRNLLEEKNRLLAQIKRKITQKLMKDNESLARGLYNWLDISGGGWGATLLTRHAPFDFSFGVNACLFASVRGSAFFNGDHYLRRGSHRYVYSITSHRGGPAEANTHQTGREANSPLFSFVAKSPPEGETLSSSASFISCDAPNVVLTALKPGAVPGEWIARFYECAGVQTNVRLTSSFPIRRSALCNMMENEISQLASDGKYTLLSLDPYKIVTIKLVLNKQFSPY